MSDLDRFELFTYVARTCNLTQAAKELRITKASLSKQIKKLELDLKVDLFTRQQQRLRLTDQGSALLEQCLRLKKELDDTRVICSQFHDEPEGELHIAAFPYFAHTLIFPKLNNFVQLYPKIKMIIQLSERVPDFEKEQVDLAIGFSLPAPLEIIRRKMASTRYVLCASADYLATHGHPRDLKHLKNFHYIGHTSRPEKLNLKPNYELSLMPYLLLNSVEAMIKCAKQGLGFIQIPLYMVEKSLEQGELIEVLSQYQENKRDVYYYYPKFRYVTPKVRKFIDFFLLSDLREEK